MGLLKHDENRAGSPDARAVQFSAQRDLKDEIEYHADRKIGCLRRNSAEVEYGDRMVTTEPVLHDADEWIVACGIPLGLLKEPQPRVE